MKEGRGRPGGWRGDQGLALPPSQLCFGLAGALCASRFRKGLCLRAELTAAPTLREAGCQQQGPVCRGRVSAQIPLEMPPGHPMSFWQKEQGAAESLFCEL